MQIKQGEGYMLIIKKVFIIVCLLLAGILAKGQDTAKTYHEPYRPQVHFSPQAHWMNDPNGMVYFDHTYHLFFQYYPNGTVWGPMHWGHAVSPDMIYWKQLPIALYPDSLGYIFSGAAVVDSNNTSGFGKNGKIPLVAIFTSHDPKGERAGTNNFQNESIAYSLDNGDSWTKYSANPVVKNPGIRDFRDPKVRWYTPGKKWVMTLATKDHITFYSSTDLKDWQKESEFGLTIGAHGGVWECPDLFPAQLNGKTYWVLIVNVNPGGPNGGSATQYFIGQFDGHTFTPIDTDTRWADYGPDEYAGITWGNTGKRNIFLGWMSNWDYATVVPTEKWRSAMTIPRELSLKQVNGDILLASEPVKELDGIKAGQTLTNIAQIKALPKQYILKLRTAKPEDYAITLSNQAGNKVIIGYDKAMNQYYIDRALSGKTNFQKNFAGRFTAPRFAVSESSDLTLVVDAASVELFADHGLTVMTAIFFPDKPLDHLGLDSKQKIQFQLSPLKSIWR
jgi:fructan beta-fructosidase